MDKQAIIKRTIEVMRQLPENKVEEVSAFADFMLKRFEEQQLTSGIAFMVSESDSFAFLSNEDEEYTASDIKKPYHG